MHQDWQDESTYKAFQPVADRATLSDSFVKSGFVSIPSFLSGAQLQECRNSVERLTGHSSRIRPAYDRSTMRRMFNPIEHDDSLRRIALGNQMIGVVEQLIGSNIALQHTKLHLDAPGISWHQDYAQYPHTNSDLVACMVYLDDTDASHGALYVLPESHKLGLLSHYEDGKFVGTVSPEDLSRSNLDGAVCLPMPAGGLTIHHSLTVHTSAGADPTRRRAVLIVEYRATDAVSLVPDRGHAQDYGMLVRGIDLLTPRCDELVTILPGRFRQERKDVRSSLLEQFRHNHANKANML